MVGLSSLMTFDVKLLCSLYFENVYHISKIPLIDEKMKDFIEIKL